MRRLQEALLFILCLASFPAQALTVKCVATAQGLRDALEATFANVDVEVRMKAGVYATGGQAFAVTLAADKHLKLSGGWMSDLCEWQQPDPSLTVLNGGNTGYVIHLSMYNNSTAPTAELSNFTVRDGNGNFAPAGGLYADLYQGSAHLLIERMHFLDNDNSGPAGAVHIRNLASGFVVLRNSLVSGNSAADGGGVGVTSQAAEAITLLVNNTISGNHATRANSAAGGFSMLFSEPPLGSVELRNNAVTGNTRGAVVSAADAFAPTWSAGFSSVNNAYSIVASGKVTDTGSLIGNPGFVGNGNFRLRGDSPLIDAGAALSAADASSRDLDFRARIAGSAPDIGAYEFDNHVFADGFEMP